MGDYLLLILVLSSILWLGKIVYSADSKNISNRTFSLLLFWVSIWMVFNFLEAEVNSKSELFLLFKLDFSSAAWISYFFLLFCLYFPVPSFRKIPKISLAIPVAIISLTSLTNLVIHDVKLASDEIQPSFSLGPIFWIYLPIVGGYIFSGILFMYLKYRKLTGLFHAQAAYVLLGMGVSGIVAVSVNLGISSFFPISVTASRMGIYSILALAWFPSYAIIRYRLMDIRIFIRESGNYLISAGATAIVFAFIVQYLTKEIRSCIFVFSICLIAPYIQSRARNWLEEHRIKKGMVDISKANSIVTLSDRIKNAGYKISDLASTATEIVMDEIPASSAVMYVIDPDKYTFNLEGQSGVNLKYSPIFNIKDSVINFFEKDKKILVKTEIARFLSTDPIYPDVIETFNILDSEVIVPLIVLDRLASLLILGAKKNHLPYYVNEINRISALANETSTALRYVMAVSRAATETKRWSHHLNQSLKPLSQAFEFIKMDNPPSATNEEREEVFDVIHRGMKKLGGFLHYLTHQSRIIDEELRNKYEHLPMNIQEILDKSISAHKISIKGKGIQFIKQINVDGIIVNGHKRDLVIVLEALLSNSIRYVPNEGEIAIKTRIKDKSLLLEISNTGPIIPPDLLEKIFAEGFQIKDGLEGTGGLGLPNARRIIGMHNGKIWAENLSEKMGVKFIIELPILKVETLAVA